MILPNYIKKIKDFPQKGKILSEIVRVKRQIKLKGDSLHEKMI